MSRKAQKPSETVGQGKPSSRREVLAGALLGLGASVLVQPNGGVAYADSTLGKKKGGKKKKSDLPKKGY